MKFNITEEDKRRIIDSNIHTLEMQIYTELLFLGINPDSFEESYLDDKTSVQDIDTYRRLRDLISRVNTLKTM